MKKYLLHIIIISVLLLLLICYIVMDSTAEKIKVISLSGKIFNAKVGDKIKGVSIIEIRPDKVVVRVGKGYTQECEYEKQYEFWPDDQNGTIYWEYPLTTLTFEHN